MLRGEKVLLRAPTRADLPTFVRWFNDPDVTQFLGGDMWPMSLEAEERWFSNALDHDRRVLCIETLPADGQAGTLIGTVGLHDISERNRHAELGISIGEKAYWSQGYGADAVRTLVRYAFEELNLHRVYLRVYSFNPRARRAYEKAGFQLEGTLRQHIFRHGAYHDEWIMAVVQSRPALP